ncbi:MAG: hypothetical protein K2J99_12405 [Lachnospiraceae bacterium]|nr:hypothetical protein [Lachnospiraceae bacterium]
MHTKTMEGLIGARANIDMTNVPMRVYKEARRKGDLATMERAMGYVNDFESKAYQYKDEADEGMKEEAKEAREKEELAREEAIEKRREERKELESQREQKRIENAENTTAPATDENLSKDEDTVSPKIDTVEISSEGQSMSNQSSSDITAKLDDPVFYSSAGAADRSACTETPALNVSV